MPQGLDKRLTRIYGRFWRSETAVMLAMAGLVGAGSGFGAVAFRRLIEVARTLFFDTVPTHLAWLPGPASPRFLIAALTPALGGLFVGLIAHFAAPEARGPGVSSVMETLTLHGGRIRPIVIAARPVATSLTLGTGGSGGREGPVVQLGSAIGSGLSQLAQLSDERTKNLVACGAAGGIAATFNAPLAGVMFALEVLLAEFGLVQFTSVVVASVIASVIGHAYFGDTPAFPFPPSAPAQTWELPIYCLLGVAAAFVGVGFTRLLYLVDDLFERQPLPPYLKPALGGILVGVVGLWFPQILGVGYDAIEAVLFSQLALSSMLALGILKVVATSLTIGSGGSAGIFGPCLFVGSMLGGLFGRLAHGLGPGAVLPPSYALVGMSAVFAAASRAPITAILTLFEMTRDYEIILPLMLTTVISAIVARHLMDDNIYTVKLSRRGIDIRAGRNLDLMSTILVGEAMTPVEDIETVTPETPLAELARIFDEKHYHGTVVVDRDFHLEGVVSLSDLEQAQVGQLTAGKVGDIQVTNVRTVFPDQSLKEALEGFGALDVGRIPVVDRSLFKDGPGHARRVVGLLRRADIIRAYSQAVLDRQARLAAIDRARLASGTRLAPGWSRPAAPPTSAENQSASIVRFRLQDHHRSAGKLVQELDLPPHCLIASVRRGGRLILPRGNTRLQAGDVIIALVTDDEDQCLQERLK